MFIIFVTIGHSFPHYINISYETLNPHCPLPGGRMDRVTLHESLMLRQIQLLPRTLALMPRLEPLPRARNSPMYSAASLSPLPCNSPGKRIHLVRHSGFHSSEVYRLIPDGLAFPLSTASTVYCSTGRISDSTSPTRSEIASAI